MRPKAIRIVVVITVAALCALAMSDSALAQCAMCRASVTQAFARNLNLAILVLLVPPVTMFLGIFFVAFRNRKG
jgi:hypothetical protein